MFSPNVVLLLLSLKISAKILLPLFCCHVQWEYLTKDSKRAKILGSKEGHLQDQVAQGFVQLDLENTKGQRLHNLSEKPIPVPDLLWASSLRFLINIMHFCYSSSCHTIQESGSFLICPLLGQGILRSPPKLFSRVNKHSSFMLPSQIKCSRSPPGWYCSVELTADYQCLSSIGNPKAGHDILNDEQLRPAIT